MRKRRFIICVTAVIASLIMVACGAPAAGPAKTSDTSAAPSTGTKVAAGQPQGTKPREVLKVAYVTSLSFSPLFSAIEKGYLAEEGIDVDLTVVTSGSDVVAFLGNGQVDAAFSNIGVPLFNASQRNIDVKIVGGVSYYPPDPNTLSASPITVRKDLADSGAVKSTKDLKGRKVALNVRGGVVEYLLDGALRSAGMTLKDVEIVTMPFPDMPAALKNGVVDAALMPEPTATVAREQGMGVVLVKNPVPDSLATILMYGANLLKPERQSTAVAFLRAVRKAANELQAPDQIMSEAHLPVWSKYTKVPEETIRKTAPYIFSKDLAVNVKSLMDQQRQLIEAGHLKLAQPVSVEQIVAKNLAVLK